MLLACRQCSTRYADELNACPGCGAENTASTEQLQASLESQLRERVANGEDDTLTRIWLKYECELAPEQIDRLMTFVASEQRGRTRDQSLMFLTRGILLCLSPAVLIFLPLGLPLLSPLAILTGLGMIAVGFFKIASGSTLGNNWTWPWVQKGELSFQTKHQQELT